METEVSCASGHMTFLQWNKNKICDVRLLNCFKISLNSAVGRDVCDESVAQDNCLLRYLDVASFQRNLLPLSSDFFEDVGGRSIENSDTYLASIHCRHCHENQKFYKVQYTYRMN